MKTRNGVCAWALAGSFAIGVSVSGAVRCDVPAGPPPTGAVAAPVAVDATVGVRHPLPANDPNIRSTSDTNPADGPILLPPPDKGGPKTRGEVCKLHVNNVCSLFVQIYVDGIYAGTIGPYGDLFPLVYSGPHKLYAVAKFDDGTASTWGPNSKLIRGQVTWKLLIPGGAAPRPTPAPPTSSEAPDAHTVLIASVIK